MNAIVRGSLQMMDDRREVLVEECDLRVTVFVVSCRLAYAIVRIRARGDHRTGILLPGNSVVGKCCTNCIAVNTDGPYIEHLVTVGLSVAKRVDEFSADDTRITGVRAIPRSHRLRKHDTGSRFDMGDGVDRFIQDAVGFL